ncbi:hypothetical protein Pmar_PMAR018330 [Perkinsus marinus ATCC 50983]|uniref:Uncharacterized protein n=1 Tax=Perkinsus marinus (strain ATCC 50983 / TXsc) TaxID=423536 RepID=C5LVT6_PERM5|nr:hypothetical protein Pmar_PMAR018330 [Perkinsus marinus ATCC 50983]EEQ99209.1 hypothetical protein Pmar_PMAR018330 [Perkinsus marinus ATCC 50983]|eukprot:XP_002766492.1 hypothetical protein Pmar_PMAR018330 [Perkinsus marinus ATCC 50983]
MSRVPNAFAPNYDDWSSPRSKAILAALATLQSTDNTEFHPSRHIVIIAFYETPSNIDCGAEY